MGAVVWNGVVARPLMPATGETVNGQSFSVPIEAHAMTLHVPALVGGGTTVKVQSLMPTEDAYTTEVWQDAYAFDVASGNSVQLDGIAESTTVTLPITATGGGMLRLVASADQSSAPVNILVFFAIQ